MLSSVIKISLAVSCAAESPAGTPVMPGSLPSFKGRDHQFYAAAVQLKRHNGLCAHTFWYSFAFSKGTDELVPLIHMKVKETDLLVAWECFWK